jgi:hypothetical protein
MTCPASGTRCSGSGTVPRCPAQRVGSRDAHLVALTESRVPAAIQPAAEAVMGHVARALHDQLRDR